MADGIGNGGARVRGAGRGAVRAVGLLGAVDGFGVRGNHPFSPPAPRFWTVFSATTGVTDIRAGPAGGCGRSALISRPDVPIDTGPLPFGFPGSRRSAGPSEPRDGFERLYRFPLTVYLTRFTMSCN